jgi:predicted anti-sigma-YlaC factor YlaD
MGKFVLVLLGVASLAFAQAANVVNPLCAMIQALANNWGIITTLMMLILGGIVVVSAVVFLVQTKFAYSFAVVIGGAVLLVATFRLLSVSGEQLRTFANTCQSVQIEVVKPVAKVEGWKRKT